jgi:hypothetical protein
MAVLEVKPAVDLLRAKLLIPNTTSNKVDIQATSKILPSLS